MAPHHFCCLSSSVLRWAHRAPCSCLSPFIPFLQSGLRQPFMLWSLCSEPFHGKLILTGPLTQFPSIASLFCLSGHCLLHIPGAAQPLSLSFYAVLPVCCILPSNLAHILLAPHPNVLPTLLSGLIASHSTHTPSTPLFLPGTATE